LKILMVHPHDVFSPHEPWTIRIVSLAREFRGMGHEVKLAYTQLDIKEKKSDVELFGIELVVLTRRVGLFSLLDNIKKLKAVSQWADVIHFQKCFHFIAIPTIVCSFIFNKPLHYEWDDWEEKIWYHSNRMSIHALIFGNFIKLLERYLPEVADTVSVASRKLEELCLSFNVRSDCIFKAPVGADLRKFAPRKPSERIRKKYRCENNEVILYLGQLHAGQYVKMFIEAAVKVLNRCPGAIFLIVGEGFMSKQLKRFVIECGIEHKVIFTGSVIHEDIPQYISASDICVASFEENEVTVCKSPLKIVEYLASGKPIVASLVGEVRNMVGGVGLLVDPGNYSALAEGIINLLENQPLRQEMGIRARRRAENRYNWHNTALTLTKAYEKAMSLCKLCDTK
jgi:glycosyltransferase involved in cell wall biosynthesis